MASKHERMGNGMLTRWELFNQLLIVAMSRQTISWITAVQIVKDVQDPHVKYNIDSTTDQDTNRELGGMVIDYVQWKTGSNPTRPDWFVKSS